MWPLHPLSLEMTFIMCLLRIPGLLPSSLFLASFFPITAVEDHATRVDNLVQLMDFHGQKSACIVARTSTCQHVHICGLYSGHTIYGHNPG